MVIRISGGFEVAGSLLAPSSVSDSAGHFAFLTNSRVMVTYLALRPQRPQVVRGRTSINAINITIQAVHQQGPWDITSQGRATASVQMILPTRHVSAPNRLEQGGSWSSGHCLTEGDPFLQLPPLGKNRGHPPPESCPPDFAAAVFSPRGSLSSQKPGASAAIAALPGRAEAGAEHMESGGWAWRGAELSAPIPPALRSVPIAHGPMAERKMAARSATDSHVPRRCRCTPPPPLAESRTQRDAQPRVAFPPLGYRTVRTRREGPEAESQFSPRSAPNPGAGVALREPRKTLLRATCTRSGHWACAVLRPGHASSPGFSRNSAGPAGGGVGRRWGWQEVGPGRVGVGRPCRGLNLSLYDWSYSGLTRLDSLFLESICE